MALSDYGSGETGRCRHISTGYGGLEVGDVTAFVDDVELADDMTVVVLRCSESPGIPG